MPLDDYKQMCENMMVAADIMKLANDYDIQYMETNAFVEICLCKLKNRTNRSSVLFAMKWLEDQGIVEREIYLTQSYFKFNKEPVSIKKGIKDSILLFIEDNKEYLWQLSKDCFLNKNSITVEEYSTRVYDALQKPEFVYNYHGKKAVKLFVDKKRSDAVAAVLLDNFADAGIISLDRKNIIVNEELMNK